MIFLLIPNEGETNPKMKGYFCWVEFKETPFSDVSPWMGYFCYSPISTPGNIPQLKVWKRMHLSKQEKGAGPKIWCMQYTLSLQESPFFAVKLVWHCRITVVVMVISTILSFCFWCGKSVVFNIAMYYTLNSAVHNIPTRETVFAVKLVWHRNIAAILMTISSHFYCDGFWQKKSAVLSQKCEHYCVFVFYHFWGGSRKKGKCDLFWGASL